MACIFVTHMKLIIRSFDQKDLNNWTDLTQGLRNTYEDKVLSIKEHVSVGNYLAAPASLSAYHFWNR